MFFVLHSSFPFIDLNGFLYNQPKKEEQVFKELGIDRNEDINEIHHWIEGNVQMASVCYVCNETITSLGAEAHRCSRCKIQVCSFLICIMI